MGLVLAEQGTRVPYQLGGLTNKLIRLAVPQYPGYKIGVTGEAALLLPGAVVGIR